MGLLPDPNDKRTPWERDIDARRNPDRLPGESRRQHRARQRKERKSESHLQHISRAGKGEMR